MYERRGNANVPILTQNYYASQMDNFAKIAPEENKAKLGLKKQVAWYQILSHKFYDRFILCSSKYQRLPTYLHT